MLLCVNLGIISLNTSFYIGFTFLSLKTYNNYFWVSSNFIKSEIF